MTTADTDTLAPVVGEEFAAVLAGLDTKAVARIVGRNPGAVRVAAHRGLRRSWLRGV